MSGDYTTFLWLLKLGAVFDVYLLARTVALAADPLLAVPAKVFFAVCAYRCLFPVRYEHYIVLHESVWSSVFATRLLATFAEVAFIFLLAYALQSLNVGGVRWVYGVAVYMVVQIVICQVCVWLAIVGEQFELYFYEELGWVFLTAALSVASIYLYGSVHGYAGREILLELNLLFAAVYLPFQVFNLRAIRANAKQQGWPGSPWTADRMVTGLWRSIQVKDRRTDAQSWGGIVGLLWMTGYWATWLPLWVYEIVVVLSRR
jgi:hypothetical protein